MRFCGLCDKFGCECKHVSATKDACDCSQYIEDAYMKTNHPQEWEARKRALMTVYAIENEKKLPADSAKERTSPNTKEMLMRLTVKVPSDFNHEDERDLDDAMGALLCNNGYKLVSSAEYVESSRADLAGFIYRHGEDDFTLWAVQLSEEDETAIKNILEKYDTDGFSLRDSGSMRIDEVF